MGRGGGGEDRMIKIGEMRYCVKRRRIKIWEIKKRKRNEDIRGRKSVGEGKMKDYKESNVRMKIKNKKIVRKRKLMSN